MAAKFITLKWVQNERHDNRAAAIDPDMEGEDDGIDLQSASATEGRSGDRVEWKPVTLSVDAIRNFYPRAGGREGCRVLLKSGAAYPVLNTHEEIVAALGEGTVDLTR